MTIGIMQPYFLPYLGYFQLMKAVDIFIYYDDVTYIKQGWINRNNIILDGREFRFTLELIGASSFKKINEIEVGRNREKLYRTFRQAYSKAPFFNEELLSDIFHTSESNLFEYIRFVNQRVLDYLGITRLIDCMSSSEVDKSHDLKGKYRVLKICKQYGVTIYINASGGQHLYSKEEFKNNGIELLFLQQAQDLPKTSIFDVIMNNSPEAVREMLEKYDLV